MKRTKRSNKNLDWYSIENPDKSSVNFLKKKFSFHELDLEDCLSENERPKLDEYDDYLFIILHFPVYIAKRRRITTTELKIFIGQNYVITIHEGNLKPLDHLFKICKKESAKEEFMNKGSGYLLYEIIQACYEYSLPLVDKTSRNLRLIEKDLFISEDDDHTDLLKEILIVKRNIINISRTLIPQSNVLIKLEIKNKKFLPENLEIYFDDIKDTADKIKDTLSLNREVIEVLQDTHESLISERTNQVMKILTVFSVVMLPLTFLTGLWGMNVNLPFSQNPYAFWIIGGIMVFIMMFMLLIFRIKKWI